MQGAHRRRSRTRSRASPTVGEIYKRDGPGVVFIRAEVTQQAESPFGLPQEQRGEATGSGFVIDKQGHILTNAHVVEGASKIEVSFGDDKTVDARLLGSDASTDVAMLKVDPGKADLEPLDPRRLLQARGRRRRGRDRQPVRARPHRHDRHRQRPRSASSRRRTASRSAT